MTYGTEIVWVGSAGHLMRYKVVDANGKYVPGGLFKTQTEADSFIKSLERDVVQVGWDGASRPILRYRDELHLPDHLRESATK